MAGHNCVGDDLNFTTLQYTIKLSVGPSVRRTAMGVRRSSVLKESSVWMYLLLVLVLCVAPVLMDTLEMQLSVMVSDTPHPQAL